jgi:rRNA maturation endonuclease Nob1
MNNKEIAAELKVALLYQDANDGAVRRIAEELGLNLRTIYDYLDCKIKPSIKFLHAAVKATDGDPAIKRILEPPGWKLVRAEDVLSPTSDWEKELSDIGIASSRLHLAVRKARQDNKIDRTEYSKIRRLIENVGVQLAEVSQLLDKEVD